MTLAEFIAHEERVRRGRPWDQPTIPVTTGEIREVGRGGLHDQIIRHCNAQWPRWKFRHARTDCPTTEELGVEDFTVFLPRNITLHVECKTANGKESPEQLAWAYEMKLLGHEVHLVRSLKEFIELCDKTMNDRPDRC